MVNNKQFGKSILHNKKSEINWESNKVTNPKITAELFNSYFFETVEKQTEQNGKAYEIHHRIQLKLFTCLEKMFLKSVLEDEVKNVAQSKGEIFSKYK